MNNEVAEDGKVIACNSEEDDLICNGLNNNNNNAIEILNQRILITIGEMVDTRR
jgi:hypothetical protein